MSAVQNNQPNIKKLSQLDLGQPAVIVAIHGTSDDIQRINMLGLRKGKQFKIVHGPGHRGAVVHVDGARIALGKEVIEQIEVVPV